MTLETYLEDLRARQAAVRPTGTPHEVQYPLGEIPIPAHVDHWAAVRPDATAIQFEDVTITYADLSDLHQRVAGWLASQGVGVGDRVALFMTNRPEFIVAFLAVLRLGAVHVPVNPMFQAAEFVYEINDAEPTLIITQESLLPIIEQSVDRIGTQRLLVIDAATGPGWPDVIASAPHEPIHDDLDALAALNYTGGTTGLPKGCTHTQRHMLYTAASTAGATGLLSDGSFVTVCFFPIYWIAGEDQGILLPVVLGGTVVLRSGWNAAEVLASVEQYRVSVLGGTVENYLELMELPQIHTTDLSSLHDVQAVSFIRKMTPEVRHAWAKIAPHSVMRESAYGMTETHTLDCIPYGFHGDDVDLLSEPVFCGLPVPGTDIAVVQFDTLDPVPIGEVGEVVVRSPSVTDGYWRNPEATESQIVDGWIHTGDNGRMDEQGCLHYLGREKEMIKVRGMSVFPAEVELLLSQHEAIDMVAVAPVEHEKLGQRPIAFVSLTSPGAASAADLEEWAARNMARYKVPGVVIVEAFPMTATGKIKKAEMVAGLGQSR